MEFCIISPVAGLKTWAIRSNRHLLLPQVQHPDYVQFYQDRRKAGDVLILDNGAYEGKNDWVLLEDMIQAYNPQICSLPDYLLQDWRKTHRAALHYLDVWYDKYPRTKWMFIPQASQDDVMGFIESLNQVLDKERQRVSWIGIPRALVTNIIKDPMMRVNICKWVKARSNCKVHALGMLKGSVAEMRLLEQARCDSIDSSAPVWRGWNNYSLLEDGWPEINIDFDARPPNERACEIIEGNLHECGILNKTPRQASAGS